MRYRTDGIATLAVVTLHEVGAGRRGATAYGYGVAARAVEDEHNERAGAHAAVQSAMRCAATVIAHRCEERRLRADLDEHLVEHAGQRAANFAQEAIEPLVAGAGEGVGLEIGRAHV